jgi:hypothetical protein
MSRGAQTFKQGDVTKALKAAAKAGLIGAAGRGAPGRLNPVRLRSTTVGAGRSERQRVG